MEKLRVARKMRGLSQGEVAERLGVSRQAYGSYETGFRDPDTTTLARLAAIFDVTTDFLLGVASDPIENPRVRLIPVLGEVPAGVPIEAVENVEEYVELYPNLVPDGEIFGLRIKGKSMEPEINNGDLALVLKQDFCSDGDIAVIRVNSEDVTVKRVRVKGNGLMLVPRNPAFEPVFFNSRQLKTLPVTIIGRVIEIRRRF